MKRFSLIFVTSILLADQAFPLGDSLGIDVPKVSAALRQGTTQRQDLLHLLKPLTPLVCKLEVPQNLRLAAEVDARFASPRSGPEYGLAFGIKGGLWRKTVEAVETNLKAANVEPKKVYATLTREIAKEGGKLSVERWLPIFARVVPPGLQKKYLFTFLAFSPIEADLCATPSVAKEAPTEFQHSRMPATAQQTVTQTRFVDRDPQYQKPDGIGFGVYASVHEYLSHAYGTEMRAIIESLAQKLKDSGKSPERVLMDYAFWYNSHVQEYKEGPSEEAILLYTPDEYRGDIKKIIALLRR